MAAFLEIRQQRAVIGADIDDEIVGFPAPASPTDSRAELGEIVAQQLGGAAGVGIFRRKDDDGIDREAELHQLAVAAMEQVGREPRLLPRHDADPHHLVDRRHVAEREHVIERGVAADLTALDRNAGAGAGGARDFARTQNVSLRVVDAVRFSGAQVGVAPVPVECRLEALRRAARAAYSPAGRVSKCRDSAAVVPPAAAFRREPTRSRVRQRARRAARDRAIVTSSSRADVIDAEMLALVAHHHDAGDQIVDEAEAAGLRAGALDRRSGAGPDGCCAASACSGAARTAGSRARTPCRGRRRCAGGRSARGRRICGRN